jgi:nucleoside-diphosphate-sugar epimerase
MRVLITGGTGHIGRAATKRLVERGWDVRIIDLADEADISGAEYAPCNILDYDNLLEHMRGCDAVIHLAAIRSPYLAPGHEVFQVNVAGTFNVFEAAAAAGIRRVVQASSINAMGAFYNIYELEPHYFPVDEEHPRFTTDPYSLSKQVIEEIGAYYWHREGISSAALRFPGVYSRGFTETETYLQKRDVARKLLDELASQPEAQQQARITDVKRRSLEFRSQRPFEFRPDQSSPFTNVLFDDPLFRMYVIDRFNLWAFVDERDAAQALEKGLTANYEGDHVLFINDSSNSLGYNSRTLIRLFFPGVREFRNGLSGSSALVSIERARTLIGFEPEYSLQNTALS